MSHIIYSTNITVNDIFKILPQYQLLQKTQTLSSFWVKLGLFTIFLLASKYLYYLLMMANDSDIVLIDSDSEVDVSYPVTKKIRLDPPKLQRAFGTLLTSDDEGDEREDKGLYQDLYNESDDEELPQGDDNERRQSSDDNEQLSQDGSGGDVTHGEDRLRDEYDRLNDTTNNDEEDLRILEEVDITQVKLLVGESPEIEDSSEEDLSQEEVLSKPSKRTIAGEASSSDDESHLGESHLGESHLEESHLEESHLEDSHLDLDLDHILDPHLMDTIPPQKIMETRKFLKKYGNEKFLERYLPTAASSEDIIRLIFLLGFVPKHVPDPSSANIMNLIKFLNYAMVKVKSIRSRLDDVCTIEDAIDKINKASKILVITGAGISTSLGIPDFRSSKGFYSQVKHLGLSDPQEVFDLELFHVDPSLFYSIAHMILPPGKIFSPLHGFIKVLQSKGKLLRNYTQNIDNLESYAGIDHDKLIQCHGSFATATCVTCKFQVDGEDIFPTMRAQEIPFCPKCKKTRIKLQANDDIFTPESYGVLKPDITFFGEPLPKTFHDLINKDLQECDLLISVGTSLKVAPVADIVDKIPETVPQILMNKDPIDHCNFDVSLLGYCDDVATYIAHELGPSWKIPHEDYFKILGDESASNLEVHCVDEEYREYEIINKLTASLQNPVEKLDPLDDQENGSDTETSISRKVTNLSTS